MPEIAKCPFCGGEAEITGRQWGDTIEYLVRCKNIDCVACNTHYLGEQDAIAAWNRRAQSDGCEWCKWIEKGYRIEYNLIDEDGNGCPDMDNVVVTGIATTCPNCGKRLGE